MRNGVCIGGINLADNKSIRLHTSTGANQPLDAPFQIGEIWSLDFEPAWNARPKPHTEDISVISQRLIKAIGEAGIEKYVKSNFKVHRGDISGLYEGNLQFTNSGKAYIQKPYVPNYSVTFWIPDENLIFFTPSPTKRIYKYKNYSFPFVGFQDMRGVIPAGKLLRMSLAYWWSPEDSDIAERCYIQLSGWYNI